jgi:hypothetical protein
MNLNLNSLNGGAAPVVNAPKSGPPVAVIVIVILVIIGIVVGVVMATMPAPKAAALPATVTPPSAAVTPPPPPPAVTPPPPPPAVTPPPPVGREVAGSSVAMTPDQMLAAKQAQADMRYAEPKLTSEQLAQAQRDAGKKMEITKTAEGIAAVDKMKKAESPPPPAAYNVKQNAIAYLADPARTSKMIGTSSGSLDVCKASCDGKPECTHFDRVGNSCTLYKGAEWVGSYPGGQSYCKSQCQT